MADKESYDVKIVTGSRLDNTGCPYCGSKTGESTLFCKSSELLPKFKCCGNIYRHICGNCEKVCIGISGNIIPGLRKALGLPPLTGK